MTDNQLSILLRAYANRLQQIKDGILTELPPEFTKTETRKRLFRMSSSESETYEVTRTPILEELQVFIDGLENEAKSLKDSAVKPKVKA